MTVAQAVVLNDTPAISSALIEAYYQLIALRPDVTSNKYFNWYRTIRTIEDALHIHPTERHTKPQE